MVVTLTLSDIQQWTPADLTALSDHFTDLAGRRGSTMEQISNTASNMDWNGLGADGKNAAIAGHAATAAADAAVLSSTAALADGAAGEMYGQQQQLLDAVQAVRSAGFTVNDDFSVTAPEWMGTAGQNAAQTMAVQLQGQAEAFRAADGQAAQDIDNSIQGFKTGQEPHPDKGAIQAQLQQVQMVPDVPGRHDYDRKCGAGHGCDFGEAWHDPVHPGMNTRQEILARDLNDVQIGPRGKVVDGWELDPYTGNKVGPSQIQIDHIYPLQRAWDMGAHSWSQEQRNLFANDPDNLIAVSGPANQAKGWMGPAEWLPPNRSEQLDYVQRYLNIAVKYHLPITQAEYQTIEGLAR